MLILLSARLDPVQVKSPFVSEVGVLLFAPPSYCEDHTAFQPLVKRAWELSSGRCLYGIWSLS